MSKKEIKPLSESMVQAISEAINKIQHVSEAKEMKGDDPCWKDYEMVGTKKKNGKEVPNCVPKEEVDPVDPKELKGKHKDRKDKDIDNDGDVDSSDEYLHKRRKAISKALAKEEKLDEKMTDDQKKTAKSLIRLGDKPRQAVKTAKGQKEKDKEFYRNAYEEVEQVEEAYKTPAEAKAYEAGKKAWRDKKKYDTNPNKKGTPEHTAWSKGHNDARAKFVKKYGSNEEKMRYESVELDEARKNQADELYFDTYSAAVQYAKAKAEKMGYAIDEDDWHDKITTGPGKPGRGKTVRHNIALTKGGKPTKKGLAIQVYNRETDKKTYELNAYVS